LVSSNSSLVSLNIKIEKILEIIELKVKKIANYCILPIIIEKILKKIELKLRNNKLLYLTPNSRKNLKLSIANLLTASTSVHGISCSLAFSIALCNFQTNVDILILAALNALVPLPDIF
jgi:hypothetical protein